MNSEEKNLVRFILCQFLTIGHANLSTNDVKQIASKLLEEEAGYEVLQAYNQWKANLDAKVLSAVRIALNCSSLGEFHLGLLWAQFVLGNNRAFKHSLTETPFEGGLTDQEVIRELEKDVPELRLREDPATGTWSLQR